jgi:hypothetical protein
VGKRNQDKFFSNGFVYEKVRANPGFLTGAYITLALVTMLNVPYSPDIANPLFARLLTYPSALVWDGLAVHARPLNAW